MGKHLLKLLVLLDLFISTSVQSQVVVQINAGSRASWGTNQNLTIDKTGHCSFYLSEVRGAIKDSSSFTISASQLDSFLTKAAQVGFFNLNSRYDGGYADGSG